MNVRCGCCRLDRSGLGWAAAAQKLWVSGPLILLRSPGDAGYMEAACNTNFGRTTASAAPVVAGRDSTRLEQPHLAFLIFEQFGCHVVKRDEFLSTQQIAFKGDHTIGKVFAALQQSQASSTAVVGTTIRLAFSARSYQA